MIDQAIAATLRAQTRRLFEDVDVKATLGLPIRHRGQRAWIVRKANLIRSFVAEFVASDDLPDMIELWGLPTKRQLSALRPWVDSDHALLPFVGDLSPSVLAVWVVVRHDASSMGIEVPWHGVSDRWMAQAVLDRIPGITIKMPDRECELWSIVKRSCEPEIKAAIGPQAMSVLDSGVRLELDALVNPFINSFEERRRIATSTL